jgi:hypothetical protein
MSSLILSSTDLEKFLFSDRVLCYNSGGVFPINKLPHNSLNKKCFIVNSDPSYLPGKHWLAIFFPPNSLPEFFDSFGKSPSFYSENLLNFLLEENSKGFIYNSFPLQSSSSTSCGMFCLYFLYHRIRGYTFSQILEKFGKNLEMNDSIVVDFYLGK